MTTWNLAAAAREQARRADGRFGAQFFNRSKQVDLGEGPIDPLGPHATALNGAALRQLAQRLESEEHPQHVASTARTICEIAQRKVHRVALHSLARTAREAFPEAQNVGFSQDPEGLGRHYFTAFGPDGDDLTHGLEWVQESDRATAASEPTIDPVIMAEQSEVDFDDSEYDVEDGYLRGMWSIDSLLSGDPHRHIGT